MLRPVVVIVALACMITFGVVGLASATEQNATEQNAAGQDEPDNIRAVIIRDHDGDVLASLPLCGDRFAVSYRNSIYGTVAEERYVALPDGRYRLAQIAADQLAVLEEYYAVPGPPTRANNGDRRLWVVPPDPDHPAVFEDLSIAATDLGERTLYIPGSPPLALWQLVEDKNPFVVLEIKENP